MPDVPANIHAIAVYDQSFRTQAGALLVAGRGARGKAEPAVGGNYAVPGQARVCRQLRQDTTDPAGCPAESGQLGEVSIADHPAGGHLGQRLVHSLPASGGMLRCRLAELNVDVCGVHRESGSGLSPGAG